MPIFKRGPGVVHEDERRPSLGSFLDHFLPIVGVALLGWLCLATMNLQQQVAVLIERTTAQNAQALILRASDCHLQDQIDVLKAGRR